jgi:hypothetical protein
MIGSAEFLLPDGSITPESRWPPSTMYWMGSTRKFSTLQSLTAHCCRERRGNCFH